MAKALSFWEGVRDESRSGFAASKGERTLVLHRRLESAEAKVALLRFFLARAAELEARRRKAERLAEESVHWHAIDRLRWQPSEEIARAAKEAFFALAKTNHPDQGGKYEDFLRLEDAYDEAQARWNRKAA